MRGVEAIPYVPSRSRATTPAGILVRSFVPRARPSALSRCARWGASPRRVGSPSSWPCRRRTLRSLPRSVTVAWASSVTLPRSRGRRALVAAAALVVPTFAGSARADAPPFELSWAVPVECPGSYDVENEVRKMTRTEQGRRPADLQVDGVIERAHGRYRLRIETRRDGRPGSQV